MRRWAAGVVVGVAAALALALPHSGSAASPLGRLHSIRAMFTCEAHTLGQLLAHAEAAAAPAGPTCLSR